LARYQPTNRFYGGCFIGMFEATIQQLVALAVLMPAVASMGGIARSQTLTPIIRGLALKQVTSVNVGALLSKECKVRGLNGVIYVALLWINDHS
jgi:magnesium transporter